jgi:outer membrane protein TolC
MWWLVLASALAGPVSPDSVVDAALTHAPGVAVAQARVDSARGAQQQSGGLRHNPELQLGVSVDGSRVQGQVSQPLSVTGEGIHDRRASTADLDSAEASLRRARFVTAADARRAYARLSLAEAALAVADKQLEGATRLRQAAEARLAVGDAPELDAQLARLEQARAVAAWLDAGQERAEALAALVSMTGLPSDLEVDPDPGAAAAALAGDATQSVRSDVTAALGATDAAQALVARERAALLPPVGLGAFYEADGDVVIGGPMLTVELPLWKQNQAGIAGARGTLSVARADLAATEARARVESGVAASRIEATTRADALLAADLGGDATAALRAIQHGYTLGETDLNTALILQSRVIEGESGWYAARAQIALARIDVALAREDPRLLGAP